MGLCRVAKKRCTTETTEFTEKNRSIFLCDLCDLCGEPSLARKEGEVEVTKVEKGVKAVGQTVSRRDFLTLSTATVLGARMALSSGTRAGQG
jgi:hypothetical protein